MRAARAFGSRRALPVEMRSASDLDGEQEMSIALRLCLFDEISADDATQYFDRAATAERTGPEFFEELEGVVIIDRCMDWDSLQEHLRFGNVDVVAVNLDRKGDQPRFLSVQRIAEVAPDCAIVVR